MKPESVTSIEGTKKRADGEYLYIIPDLLIIKNMWNWESTNIEDITEIVKKVEKEIVKNIPIRERYRRKREDMIMLPTILKVKVNFGKYKISIARYIAKNIRYKPL